MNRILFISEKKGYLMSSLKEQLERRAYSVTVTQANMDVINLMKESVKGVLIFADELLNEQTASLIFLKDWTIESGVPLFVLGNPADIEELKSVLPAHLITREFFRPIRILANEIVKQMDDLIVRNVARKKILIMSVHGRAAKSRLKNKYTIFLSKSCASAVKNLALNRPDLVLIDPKMADSDGKKVAETIRTESEFSDIPVIFSQIEDDKGIAEAIEDFFKKLRANM